MPTDAKLARAQLAKVRAFVTALPGVTERASHSAETWFVNGRVLAYFCNDHHGDNRIALWLPAPDGAQAMLVDSSPEVYFVPPYVGKGGWVGVRLDRDAAWGEIEVMLEGAHTMISALKKGSSGATKSKSKPRPRKRAKARARR
jgi:hypothetical protein